MLLPQKSSSHRLPIRSTMRMLSAMLLDTMILKPCLMPRLTSVLLVWNKEDLAHVLEDLLTTRLRDISMRTPISRDSLVSKVHLHWSRLANTGSQLATRTQHSLLLSSTRRTSHSSVLLEPLRLATAQEPHGQVLPSDLTTRQKSSLSKK